MHNLQQTSLIVIREKVDKYRNIFNFFLFLWGVLFTFSFLIALEPGKAVTQYKLDTWQREHGFTQNSVNVIYQTRDGYIWLGTMDGLIRFDGIVFKIFDKENTKQFQDNFITSLLEDQKDNLWIGTSQGGLYCLKDKEFKPYTSGAYPNLKKISAIFEDRQGILWLGTVDNGLTRLENGKFTTYTVEDGLASNRVRDFYEDKRGYLWIATSAGLSIRTTSGKFTVYTTNNGRFDKFITSMCSAKNGGLWLGCLDGIYRLDNNEFTHFGKTDGLPSPKIICLYEDNQQNLWAGTDGGGLIRMRKNKIETFPTGDLLASTYICSIYEDREKNLWIGSLKDGLYRLRDTLFIPYATREGLGDDIVNCITESRNGNLWIGTIKGVNRMKNGQFILEWSTNHGLLSNHITSICEDSTGSIWIGTDEGLNRIKDGKLERCNYHIDALSKYITEVWEDRRCTVWILTPDNLIRFYNEKFTLLINKKETPGYSFICFHLDKEANHWIGTYRGGIYRIKEGKLTVYTTREGLVNNEVESFYEDKQGILYIGTRGGLSLLANGKFTSYTTQNGLTDNYIYHILEDDLGYLWLSGRTGVSRINTEKLWELTNGKIEKIEPDIFNEPDGIKDPICHHFIKTQDGRLWFATDKGLLMIDPLKIKEKRQAPPVVIEEMIIDGEAFLIREPLIIPPGKKRLEFHYTGLSLVKSRQIKFKLKLEGYDSDWMDAGHARSTTYTGLSPGGYTFRVTACNSDGVWNQEGASLSFYLKPYFYQTTWFYLLVVLSVLLLAFSIYRFRVRQLKTREKELGTLVELRTRDLKERNLELEKARQNIQHSKELIETKNQQLEEQSEKLKEMDEIKSRFFANISHEFRTPLTLLMGPLEQMIAACSEDEKEKKRKLTLMLRNAQRLLRLINQLLELSKLDSGKMKLQAEKINIISFLKGIIDSFRFMAQQKELELAFHPETEIEDITLYIDPRKMEDVMSNLLVNAFKFTPPGGKITVSVKRNLTTEENFPEGYVEISVCDTGPGIPGEQLIHIFDRFYQADATYEYHEKGSGIGLALSKELVELHHGAIEAGSREGEGSTFIIRLSLGSEHLAPDEIVDLSAAQARPPSDIKISEKITVMESVIEEEQEIEPETALEPEDKTGETNIILVVEDSADMRVYIRGALESAYTVVDAKDGRDGIEKAKVIIPDLIISDIMMPEVDGYELCGVLKSDVKTSHIPIIMLTAKASEENILQGLETGADDYITKPFNTKILIARIKNLIDIRSQLQKNINRQMTLQPVKTSVSKIDQAFFHDLHEVINKNLSDEEFNVEQLCKKLYMGRTTLYRKVLALTGETPTDFIRSYRLKRGAELLKQNFGTVLEVAFEVGFSNSSYFAKCFKEKFHQLPSEYQAANKS
jgi:signal transduction histidine kinase/ligand-binding sensor domain-containing protein/DNA-binding response OmpR family regulator